MKHPQIYQSKVICIPFDQGQYSEVVNNPKIFRDHLDRYYNYHPEPFPPGFELGYKMKDITTSKKLGIRLRRISIEGTAYTVRPSFVMPYMTAFTNDVEGPLFLRKFDVPFWAVAKVFGRYPMYWYRMERSLGRNSLAGTIIQAPDNLPEHLGVDEKHSRCCGKKVYVATTVGEECILGASIAQKASNADLLAIYKVFKEEAQEVAPDYSPKTVNTDGYLPTRTAWRALFPMVALVTCFLHLFIKLRDGSKKKFQHFFDKVADRLWNCYRAESKGSFSQRVRRFHEWAVSSELPDRMVKVVTKLRKNLSFYSRAYDHPDAHRTSNMLDRLMRRMDRHLFNAVYFHGSLEAAELGLRGWVLLQNFTPLNPATVKKHRGARSRAERINGYRYHDSWLQNLLISASLGGHRGPPQNP